MIQRSYCVSETIGDYMLAAEYSKRTRFGMITQILALSSTLVQANCETVMKLHHGQMFYPIEKKYEMDRQLSMIVDHFFLYRIVALGCCS